MDKVTTGTTIQLLGYKGEPLLIKSSDIVYLQGDGKYTHFHLKDGRKVTSSYPLMRFHQALPQFWRISKAYLVNPDYVQTFNARGGVGIKNGYVKLKNGQHFDVARRRVGPTYFMLLVGKSVKAPLTGQLQPV